MRVRITLVLTATGMHTHVQPHMYIHAKLIIENLTRQFDVYLECDTFVFVKLIFLNIYSTAEGGIGAHTYNLRTWSEAQGCWTAWATK